MPAQLGKTYVAPGGAPLMVTKGGPGTLGDGDTALVRNDGVGMGINDAKPLASSH